MALKHNSKKVLDIISTQGKERNATKAYKEVHPNATTKTAQAAVNKLLNKPEASLYLQEHVNEASVTVIDVMRNARTQTDSPAFQRLAKDSAESVLNRELGTPTQTIRQTVTGVSLNIDLTTSLLDEDSTQ